MRTIIAFVAALIAGCGYGPASPSPTPRPAITEPAPLPAPPVATFRVSLQNTFGIIGEQYIFLPRPLPTQEEPQRPAIWQGSAAITRVPQHGAGAPDRIRISCGGRAPQTSEPLGYEPGVVGTIPVVCGYHAPGRWTIRVDVDANGETISASTTVLIRE